MAHPRILDTPIIGKVYNAGSLPTTTDKFYAVHPVYPSGLDGSNQVPAEGGTLGYSVDTSTTLLFHVIGSTNPSVDDLLIGHYVGNGIWVAERMHVTTGGTVSTPGCGCITSPATINMVVTSSTPCGVTGQFVNCSMPYGAPPSWASSLSLGPQCWFGATGFIDPIFGDTFYPVILCNAGTSAKYVYVQVYQTSGYGSPFRSPTMATWTVGGSNVCSPFSMVSPSSFSGCSVHLTG